MGRVPPILPNGEVRRRLAVLMDLHEADIIAAGQQVGARERPFSELIGVARINRLNALLEAERDRSARFRCWIADQLLTAE